MKFPDCHTWLTTGVIPVFITEDMEEWLEIEGHPEMVVKDQGRQGGPDGLLCTGAMSPEPRDFFERLD